MKRILMPILASAFIASSAFAGGKGVIQTDDVVIDIPDEMESIVYGTYYTVGLKVGTLGLGLDVSYPLTHNFSIRGNINGLNYTSSINDILSSEDGFESLGANADLTVDFLTAGLLVDYFPFEHSDFRLSAGVYYNANELSVQATSKDNQSFTGVTFTPDELGTATGKLVVDEISPYIGIGWGNRGDEKGWSWSLDIGALYQNVPKIELNADPDIAQIITNATAIDPTTGLLIATNAEFQNLVTQEEVKANNEIQSSELKDYTKFWPVIAFGITYSF